MTIDAERPRILLVDSYDSFTHNLAALCRRCIPNCRIHIIKNDEFTIAQLLPYLPYFFAIVVGPGPGSPENLRDIGIVRDLWKVEDRDLIPIFGVCLGLQSLGVEFGASLKKLRVVKHGQVSRIIHHGTEIFKGVGDVSAVRYHSLHVELAKNGEVEELAFSDDGPDNGRVVMAARHISRPFWAVQYHPESVLTKGGGIEVFQNFWSLAIAWATSHGRTQRCWSMHTELSLGHEWPYLAPHSPLASPVQCTASKVTTEILELPDLSITTIAELLGASRESTPFLLLDSAARPGRYSIVAALTPTSPRITYLVGDPFVRVSKGDTSTCELLGSHDIWSWIAAFMRVRKAQGGSADIPFWGGLIGYLSYELGVHTLGVPLNDLPDHGGNPNLHADVSLIFVERSLVLDSLTGKIYVQSLRSDDETWIAETGHILKRAAGCIPDTELKSSSKRRRTVTSKPTPTKVIFPDKNLYKSRINLAKEHLFDGDSYELCLTAQTRLSIPNTTFHSSSSSSWERYKKLRINNPAPFSAYLRLHPSTLLSSSPERFLSFSRPPGTTCQLRPIKGTVRKSPGVTRAVAEQLLAGSTKEVAENLMIVDLIRHDLHGVLGEDVKVKQFCSVEEYETVWQLVSVIEGSLSAGGAEGRLDDGELGWEVLRRSLPPGSMTGAPKKRSVEILQTLEDNDRSLYSGVFGYWCVGGGGDFSVTIRSCFKYNADHGHPFAELASSTHDLKIPKQKTDGTEDWVIGAGGAITALSDPDAEWDEMIVKLQSVLRTFGISDSIS